ncbi:MAG TPA: ABC transporter permease [Pyrinomonadaceae bacterium]|jgi:putative ABC transport system permease protein
MTTLLQDVRYGLRVLWQKPGFTAVAVLTLALGIGANTAVFSLVSAVLVRPLKYREAERLVMVWEDETAAGFPRETPAVANYADWRAQNKSFEDVAAVDQRTYDLTGRGGEPEKILGFGVTSNFFPLLGAEAALGRTLLPEEDKPGAHRVAVLSHGLWQRRFGGERSAVGGEVMLNGEPYTVVGVMPADFQFEYADVALWVPVAFTPEQLANRGNHYLEVVARMKPGVTAAQAEEDVKAITRGIAESHPDEATGLSAAVVPLREHLAGEVRRPLLLLLAAVALVLLIACANVAGVLLSRAAARRREIAVRAALGASRRRIVRQLMTEGALLSAAGGLLGTLLALWTFAFLQQLVPAGMRAMAEPRLDSAVLGFTLLVSLAASVAFGLAPALQASKTDLNDALKQAAGRSSTGAGRRLRGAFVVAEVALALVLLVGAGLVVRTLYNLRGQYAGLKPESVMTLRTQLAENRYREPARRAAFYDGVLERVKGLPGVVAAGYTTAVPLTRKGGANGLSVEGKENGPNAVWNANHRQVSPDYFRALGLAVREGRGLTEQDDEGAPPVAVVNETMARSFWPGETAVGRRFKVGAPESPQPWLTVVGVVQDVRQMASDEPVKAEMYVHYRQAMRHFPSPGFASFAPRDLVVRTSVAPTSIVPAVREAVRELDASQPVSSVRTLEEVLGRDTAQRRVGVILLAAFAGLALLLAALGIYGVLAFFVVQHTPEIGVRMALGASPGDMLLMVVGRGMKLALAGVGVGLAAALVLTRLIESQLFGVSATDPFTFAGLALLLAAVALLACLVPARRATKVDPMVALRYE